MLLTEISAFPINTALIVTANSGADVPMAITVKPITKSEMPHAWASLEDDSISQSDPFHNRPIETMTSRKLSIKMEKCILSEDKIVPEGDRLKLVKTSLPKRYRKKVPRL